MRKVYLKDFNILRLIVLSSFLLFSIFTFVIFLIEPVLASSTPINNPLNETGEFIGDFSSWETGLTPPATASDYYTYTEFRDDYCTDLTSPEDCLTLVNGKYIRFDTADELYRFSTDVSFGNVDIEAAPAVIAAIESKIDFLLSLTYKLGGNIDYSVMNARTFIPIGYWFYDVDNNLRKKVFHGTFDGQGFSISNLYVAGYDYITDLEITAQSAEVYVATSAYYSMFTFNEGFIKNLGLLNPTLEMLQVHIDITKTANLVGLNFGTVDHVYVIDNRTATNAGIRYNVGTTSLSFSAAGIVHTNQGILTNAYYSSLIVINPSYINKFTVQPVVYANSATGTQLVYDSSIYLSSVVVGGSTYTITPANQFLAVGEATTLLKTDSSSLNDADDRWYFYPTVGYPLLLGLEYVDTYYLIDSAIDFWFFSKLIAYSSTYANAKYKLTGNIDMSVLATGSYVTPSVSFNGTLTGKHGSTLDENYYIYNLSLTKGVVSSNVYYAGIFSILSGTVDDINIVNSSIILSDTESYYSMTFYVGMIAGQLAAGTIENVQTDADVNLGTSAIGETHVGGVTGKASGIINQVSVSGSLIVGSHTYQPTYIITPRFYVGGIVGSATGNMLRMEDVVNNGTISGFGSSSSFGFASGFTNIQVKIGGVVGYILNTASIKHQFINLANKGSITILNVSDTTTPDPTQHVGGIFGELSGNAPLIESSTELLFANFYNSGNISATFEASKAFIKSAGIGVNNSTEAVEYAYLSNEGNFSLGGTLTASSNTTNPMFLYTGLIFDVGTYPVTISYAFNHSPRTYASPYYITISPFYHSVNNVETLIRYSANYGDITYTNGSTITLSGTLSINGLSASENISYLNTYNYGNISVINVNVQSFGMFVSGFSRLLTSGRHIKNSVNQGNIIIADITGTSNIYIAGMVTRNESGDLHLISDEQPHATIGIINSMNKGSIKSTSSTTIFGIDGTIRTFAAGIATLNKGSIQDSANVGDIQLYSSVAGSTIFATTLGSGGSLTSYTSGITAGGIVAVVLSETSRIYDSSNNGEIVVLATNYARAGGVLGISNYNEANLGQLTSLGLANNVQNSVLSNCLNMGEVVTLTSTIGLYNSAATFHDSTISYNGLSGNGANLYLVAPYGSTSRPGVNASAGGVIGYGLCVMTKMLNHGTIASTDVAGGVVGATYVTGGTSDNPTITGVNIDTAINYGDIKAFSNASYSGLTKSNFGFDTLIFLDDGNTTIFPTDATREEPATKRGFGGVFGRVQRGQFGVMDAQGEGYKFNFIVNANANIDLIGRLDQDATFTGSSKYFRFNNSVYYSARQNDTTQVVFTGFYYAIGPLAARSGSASPYTNVGTATTLYKNVGMVGTQFSTPGTTYVWRSSVAYTVQTQYGAYYGPIEVPWISETELWNSDFTNYVYDENFNMRKIQDSYSFAGTREYTIDGVSGDLEDPNGSQVIASSMIFSDYDAALAYKTANPLSTPYYYDSEDIRNLDKERVYAKGLPYTAQLKFPYNTILSTNTRIYDTLYLTYALSGGDLVGQTASNTIFNTLALATTYNTVYNTPAYYNNSSSTASSRGIWIWNGSTFVRTHENQLQNSTTFQALAGSGYVTYYLNSGSMYMSTTYTEANKRIDSTILKTTLLLAQAVPFKMVLYYTGTAGASNLVQVGNPSNIFTYVSTNNFTNNSDPYVLSSGNLALRIPSSSIFTNLNTAYVYKQNNPGISTYYRDSKGNYFGVTLNSVFYRSTNYTIDSSNRLVDGTGFVVLPAADLDGSPYSIDPNSGNIVDAAGVVLFSFTPALTEYIYFMKNDLLATRFTSIRPNGMYVLSTTSGSTYGSVLPANILTELLEPTESNTFTQAAYSSLLASYDELRQTIFNDKSSLIENSSIILTEIDGSESSLINGVIDNSNHTISFDISLEAFESTQTSASFQVSEALASAYALIAIRFSDYQVSLPASTLVELRTDLYNEKSLGISLEDAPLIAVSIPSNRTIDTLGVSAGYLAVYSEAFLGDDYFATLHYYTEYQIFINFTAAGGTNVSLDSVAFNGNTAIDATGYQTNVTTLGDANYNGTITFNFVDSNGTILLDGFDFSQYLVLKYNDVIVESQYYTITPTPAANASYSVQLNFSSKMLRSGTYTLYYRYFMFGTQYSVVFDKSMSTENTLSSIGYYSMNGSSIIGANSISSSVNFGYQLNIQTNGFTTVNPSFNVETYPYLSFYTYNVGFMTASAFVISPFATLSNLTYSGYIYTNGYRSYTITYTITSESGANNVYAHTITERLVEIVSVKKNGNEVALGSITASREDELTTFTIEMSLDSNISGLYNMNQSFDPFISIIVTDQTGISYSTPEYLDILMNYLTLPGDYIFTIRINREGVYATITTSLTITKLKGEDSYLKDIKFSLISSGTSYPDINEATLTGEIDTTSTFDPRIYFGGIDYAGMSGTDNHFRIDGRLTSIQVPFNSYAPYMVDYLPYGATISKGIWNGSTYVFGTEVGRGATDTSSLIADYTLDQKTLLPGVALVPYRVRSENDTAYNYTYYWITVTDVTYNVTLVFDIYYCTDETQGSCSIQNTVTEFPSTLFLITIKNYETEMAVGLDTINNPVDYPAFTSILKLNNQMAQFNFTNTVGLKYSFGRNMSGYYVFDVGLPLDEYLNPLYTYEIGYGIYFLDDASERVEGLLGKYYYIGYSENNRTSTFNIYVRDAAPSVDRPWGLYDFFRSWFVN